MSQLPLASFPIASTSDTDEAQSILSRTLMDLRFRKVKDRRRFLLEMSGVHLGRTMIGYNQFSTDTVVDPGEVDGAVAMIVGVGSPLTVQIDDESIVCREKAAVVSPTRRVMLHRPEGGGAFVIRAGADAILQRFRDMTGVNPNGPIIFDRSVDLAGGVGAHARSLLDFVVGEIHRDRQILKNPLLRTGFDEMLLNALLSLPNNHSELLINGRKHVAPSGLVQRAEEFLKAHATEPITISHLVVECRCSERSLFNAFLKHRAYTPMQFLTECRLRSAREALQSASPDDTITSIAYNCGFSHVGRFSTTYRKRFGESPSETMRRG